MDRVTTSSDTVIDAEFIDDEPQVSRGPVDAIAADVQIARGAIGRIVNSGRGILRELSRHVGAEQRTILPR
jgi:hypothetical protein